MQAQEERQRRPQAKEVQATLRQAQDQEDLLQRRRLGQQEWQQGQHQQDLLNLLSCSNKFIQDTKKLQNLVFLFEKCFINSWAKRKTVLLPKEGLTCADGFG